MPELEVAYHTLKAAPGQIALACDAWTASLRIAFLSITAAYIDKDWKLHDVVIAFEQLHGSHSGENLGTVVYEAMRDLEILGKVSTPEK